MLSVKQELLAALAGELETLSPGAGARAAFESPKVAAHGDFACTAAMQLAKPLKLNPRSLGEQLKAALEATPSFQRWVDAIEIAGPGFLNIRLKPAAKQQIIREVLEQAEKFGWLADRGAKMLVEFVSANPTGPLHVGHGRQAALGVRQQADGALQGLGGAGQRRVRLDRGVRGQGLKQGCQHGGVGTVGAQRQAGQRVHALRGGAQAGGQQPGRFG